MADPGFPGRGGRAVPWIRKWLEWESAAGRYLILRNLISQASFKFIFCLFLPPKPPKLAKVMFSQVFVCPQGGGGLCPEGSLPRGVSVRKIPPYGYVRAVCILLEYIFVCRLICDNCYDSSW